MLGDALKIGLTPNEFWKSTTKEIRLRMEAYLWQKDQQGVMFSTFTAALMNVHIGKKSKMVKPNDLYRPILVNHSELKKKGVPTTKEEWAERKKQFEETVARMGPQAIPVLPKEQRMALRKQKEAEQNSN